MKKFHWIWALKFVYLSLVPTVFLRHVACKQAHLLGRGAATESWREEWGEEKWSHTFPRFAGSRYPNKWTCLRAGFTTCNGKTEFKQFRFSFTHATGKRNSRFRFRFLFSSLRKQPSFFAHSGRERGRTAVFADYLFSYSGAHHLEPPSSHWKRNSSFYFLFPFSYNFGRHISIVMFIFSLSFSYDIENRSLNFDFRFLVSVILPLSGKMLALPFTNTDQLETTSLMKSLCAIFLLRK